MLFANAFIDTRLFFTLRSLSQILISRRCSRCNPRIYIKKKDYVKFHSFLSSLIIATNLHISKKHDVYPPSAGHLCARRCELLAPLKSLNEQFEASRH